MSDGWAGLNASQWATLAHLYRAGNAGESADELNDGAGVAGWHTRCRLMDYYPQPLIEPSLGEWIDELLQPHELRYRITAAGRAYYEHEWARYRALYPDIEAPEPADHMTDR